MSKLLKINISGEVSHMGSNDKHENVTQGRVHTNVSLLSKFRTFLTEESILKTEFDVTKINIGDFIAVDGELQKNPLIDCMDKFSDVFRMAEIFSTEAESGNRTQAKAQKKQEQAMVKQIQSFFDELKHSGTTDFVLSDTKGTVVLSLQEQYLSNNNISEILGGRFKVLGKVIAVCKDNSESIDLLRKTTRSILPEAILNTLFIAFQNEDLNRV